VEKARKNLGGEDAWKLATDPNGEISTQDLSLYPPHTPDHSGNSREGVSA
jgi:hypothetical protein